jgi:mannose-6-phosphate isomerase
VVVLEVQQNSNTTFRLHDWNRLGLDGKPRELHPEQSRRAMVPALRMRKQTARKLRGAPFPASRLVACDKFVMDFWEVSHRVTLRKPKRFEIFHVLSGNGRLSDNRWPPVALSKGRTVLLPASIQKYEVRPTRSLRLIRVAEGEI